MSLTNQRKQVYNKRDMRYLPCLVRRRLHKKNTWYTLLWRSCIVPERTDLCTPRRSRGWSRMQSCQEGEEENCLRGNSCTVSPPPSWWSSRTCEMILAWLQLSSESPAGPECTGHRWCPGQLSCCGSHCRSSPWAECWRSEPGRVSPWRPWSDWQSSLRGWSLSPPGIGLLVQCHHILAFSRPHTDVFELFWLIPTLFAILLKIKLKLCMKGLKSAFFFSDMAIKSSYINILVQPHMITEIMMIWSHLVLFHVSQSQLLHGGIFVERIGIGDLRTGTPVQIFFILLCRENITRVHHSLHIRRYSPSWPK